tara:strand:+ start:83 stop:853 length:771 start_codon:yes stop_codon:yes gene_type:complete
MAVTILFDINRFNRFLSVYEQSQTQFAGKRALTKFGQRIKGSQGLAQRYKRIFREPVPFTLNSTFTVQRGLELDIGIKDRIEKGNPAGKYLFPPIGVGSGKAFDTQFTQYLRDRNLIERSDYPFAATSHPLVRTNKYGNVTPTTYGNTKRALGKTRKAKGRTGFAGGNAKIGDQRVFAIKKDGDGKNKKLKAGIYREQVGRGKNKFEVRALFYYGKIPSQKKGGSGGTKLFPEIVKDFADAQLLKIWLREIKQLAK